MIADLAGDVKGPEAPSLRETSYPDLFTILAITIVTTVLTSFIHEAIGHGGMCVATGGNAMVLSTVHFECSAEPRLVAAGGTLANLLFGALSWPIARAIRKSASWRYFFWQMMAFNLFDAGGYFLFSGVGNFGDWAAVVAGWHPAWAWRVGLIALGVVTYFLLFVPLCLRELRPFLGKDPIVRVQRARRMTVVPYLATGILACIAGALNPVSPLLILLSAAAASFGGKSGLAWMWTLLRGTRIPSSELQMPEIQHRWGWMVAAILVAIVFIAVLGPGVKFHSAS
jgi:hypothetical protein